MESGDYSNLRPSLQLLADPAVLVQAWKKAHAFIRSHNWFADSLELDLSTIRLHELIAEWSDLLAPSQVRNYSPDPMRIVPAPKTSDWKVEDGWRPKDPEKFRLRPLAHLTIRDQTVAVAALICMANLVETKQGDPTQIITVANRHKCVSYGNRLVCTYTDGNANFRWGNAKLYRQYFEDYQSFVRRPERIRQELVPDSDKWAIVQADLSRFYDRVSRDGLVLRLETLFEEAFGGLKTVEQRFFKTLRQMFNWQWHADDREMAAELCGTNPNLGLPQGLAASGFFANAYLLDFDAKIASTFDQQIEGRSWKIVDYCRYVDDMRFVIKFTGKKAKGFRKQIVDLINSCLKQHAPELELNHDKTSVTYGGSHESSLPVADAIRSVTRSVSGPLDTDTAIHVLEALDGLLAVSNATTEKLEPTKTGADMEIRRAFAVDPDVRIDSLERFVAHRWRKVFRELRLMADEGDGSESDLWFGRTMLDRRAKTFAAELLRKWMFDPSNVRLLRVSLDLVPYVEHLNLVLKLLLAVLDNDECPLKIRKCVQYVAAEVLRAGATETGFVRDIHALPANIDMVAYRSRLRDFANQILDAKEPHPWYLTQQALLFLAVIDEPHATSTDEQNTYIELHGVLRGKWPTSLNESENLGLALVAYRIVGATVNVVTAVSNWIKDSEPSDVLEQLHYFAEEDDLLWRALERLPPRRRQFWKTQVHSVGWNSLYSDSGWKPVEDDETSYTLSQLILSPKNPFQDEIAALRLVDALAQKWSQRKIRRDSGDGVLTPSRIRITCNSWDGLRDPGASVDFALTISLPDDWQDPRFDSPKWCRNSDRWKRDVGQILRAAVIGKTDFTQPFFTPHVVRGCSRYRGISSGWFKRKHGLFSDRQGLGHRTLAVSPWLAEMLGRLLEWPGTSHRLELVALPSSFTAEELRECVHRRISLLNKNYCRLSGMPLYTFPVSNPDSLNETKQLRVAFVQTALPKLSEFNDDLKQNLPATRTRHRRHLTSMLRLLLKTLDVRASYKGKRESIDLVLFPELAVHQDDIFHVERFADSLKCLVFCGLVFHEHPNDPTKLINSGLWIIPTKTSDGRSMRYVEQGKEHLSRLESAPNIVGYRPCQWLLEYRRKNSPTWNLSAAICYDATDLRLAADLRNQSDAFIVSALNPDTGTFDAMVSALHYHMYQHVLLVNTAEFGGSTGQAPYKEPFRKTILHQHGIDQASVNVIELDLDRFKNGLAYSNDDGSKRKLTTLPPTKYPPAGFDRA